MLDESSLLIDMIGFLLVVKFLQSGMAGFTGVMMMLQLLKTLLFTILRSKKGIYLTLLESLELLYRTDMLFLLIKNSFKNTLLRGFILGGSLKKKDRKDMISL